MTASSISFFAASAIASASSALEHPVGDELRAEAWNRVSALRGLVLLDSAEDRDRLVLGEVERHTGRGDDVPVRAQSR